MRPFAFETTTKDELEPSRRALPAGGPLRHERAHRPHRAGADDEALRERDRDAVLFDLGLGALQVDCCVRVADPEVAAQLRAHCGQPVFAAPAMGIILAANPHRVFLSRLGRIEVFQPIPPPDGKSPDGPHTHVLPGLLRHRRTHAATEPIPDGWCRARISIRRIRRRTAWATAGRSTARATTHSRRSCAATAIRNSWR